MTEEQAASTYSGKTDNSNSWPKATALGAKILDDLGLATTTDTLSRWMAHRIAELIVKGESEEDEDARQRATQLIFELWERRSDWPSGWPPAKSAAVIERLAETEERSEVRPRPSGGEPEDPWLARIGVADDLAHAEWALWRDACLTQIETDPEPEGKLEELLSVAELRTLRRLGVLERAAVRRFSGDAGKLTDEELIKRLRTELEQLAAKREELLQEVEEAIRTRSSACASGQADGHHASGLDEGLDL